MFLLTPLSGRILFAKTADGPFRCGPAAVIPPADTIAG